MLPIQKQELFPPVSMLIFKKILIMKKRITNIIALGAVFFSVLSCDIDEKLNDAISENDPKAETLSTPSQSLAYTYTLLEGAGSPWSIWTLNEDSSDEEAKPTRGSDWYDGGKWQQLHLHTWTPSNPQVVVSFDDINKGIAYATQVLGFSNATQQEKAEATFLQTYFLWLLTDHFGQTILREPKEVSSVPSIYWTRAEAVDKEIERLEAVVEDLPNYTPSTAFKASKNAGYALLARLYLNRAVYKATDSDGKPQEVTPSMFQSADMDKVIEYADKAMIGTSFTNIAGNTPGENYFQNFAPDNGEKSTEIIFSKQNTNTIGSAMFQFSFMTTHYKQIPDGYNGPVTTTDLYNKFISKDPNDPRLSTSLSYLTTNSGIKAGLLLGQQYDYNGVALKTRTGAPLIFTTDFDLSSSNESQGIRVIKYLPDFSAVGKVNSNANNDFIFLSLSDCLLMKAEAYARKGNFTTANTLVGNLRTARGAASITVSSLQDILDERARELYWQGHRRTDQIRFGTFLQPCQGRSTTSDRHVMVFPIPVAALTAAPTMHQNPGY